MRPPRARVGRGERLRECRQVPAWRDRFGHAAGLCPPVWPAAIDTCQVFVGRFLGEFSNILCDREIGVQENSQKKLTRVNFICYDADNGTVRSIRRALRPLADRVARSSVLPLCGWGLGASRSESRGAENTKMAFRSNRGGACGCRMRSGCEWAALKGGGESCQLLVIPPGSAPSPSARHLVNAVYHCATRAGRPRENQPESAIRSRQSAAPWRTQVRGPGTKGIRRRRWRPDSIAVSCEPVT